MGENLFFEIRLVLLKIQCSKTNTLIRWPLQTRPSKWKQINTQGLTETKSTEKSQTQKNKSKSRQKKILKIIFLNKYWNASAAIVISALNVLNVLVYTHIY